MAKQDKNGDSAKTEATNGDSVLPSVETLNDGTQDLQRNQSATTAKVPHIPKRVMYLGDSFSENGVLFSHGQIFSNGLPQPWLEKAILDPNFRRLLVPIDQVNKVKAELRNPESMLSTCRRGIVKPTAPAKTRKGK